jgi:endo-1,4-beta-xylanase
MNGRRIFLLLWCLVAVAAVWGQNPIGLKASSAIRGLTFGTAASIENLRKNADDGQFNSFILKNYQLIEPENDLKPQKLWRGENNYDWNDSDWLLGATPQSTGWAQQNSMEIRGHTLLWATDATTPSWLLQQESSISPDKAKSLLSSYIHAVVGRYQGKIPSWDVVNEAIDDAENNGRPFNMRNGFWYRKLGQDFVKFAFIFAHEADPQAKLYYNDYNTEGMSSKANNAFQLIKWAKSQGAPIHGVGMQWHVGLWAMVYPGDQYYQNAQRLIDDGFDFMVTELDVALPMNGDNPRDPDDLEKQGAVYRSLLKYALHFSPRCRAFITWGFTDRYSWIPPFSDYRDGAALPADWNYQPKSAYWQMQEELARVLPDGTYRLAPQSQPTKSLDTYDNGIAGGIQIYSTGGNAPNQKWNLAWLGDGTYRLTPVSNNARALDTYNENSVQGGVQAHGWWGGDNQRWVLSPVGSNNFRIAPRTVWWRALTVLGTSNVVIQDYVNSGDQHWTLTNV